MNVCFYFTNQAQNIYFQAIISWWILLSAALLASAHVSFLPCKPLLIRSSVFLSGTAWMAPKSVRSSLSGRGMPLPGKKQLAMFLFTHPFIGLSGTLNLKVKHDEEPEHILWTRTGSHGAVWHRGLSNIPHQPAQNYQVSSSCPVNQAF